MRALYNKMQMKQYVARNIYIFCPKLVCQSVCRHCSSPVLLKMCAKKKKAESNFKKLQQVFFQNGSDRQNVSFTSLVTFMSLRVPLR